MEPLEIINLIEEDDDILSSIQTTLSVILHSKNQPKRGGSTFGRKEINRNRLQGHQQLYNDYFAEQPNYPEDLFRRRFRMRKALFLKIVNAVEVYDTYFVQKRDAAGRLGFSSLQKVTTAFRLLAYGYSADSVDEYLQISESTALETLKRFCSAVVDLYSEEYLRRPNKDDIQALLSVSERRGFPGMIGSLDCMHWAWKNCPISDHGQYSGKEKEPTIILEAVAGHNLWIWHAFFGLPGTLNDISVLDRSPIFQQSQDGTDYLIKYTVNGQSYNTAYYLTDGIYPKYSTLIQSISEPQEAKTKYFARMHEAYRKDVKRAFGVLQSRYAIIRFPGRLWGQKDLSQIMKAVIILHNMTIEDEEGTLYSNDFDYHQNHRTKATIEVNRNSNSDFDAFLLRYQRIRDIQSHNRLKADLIEHLWQKLGHHSSD